jgi:hypothetical protein
MSDRRCRFCQQVFKVSRYHPHQLERKVPDSLKERFLTVRRDSAVKLVDDLAGGSPVSADYPVGTVVISGDGAGDQAVGSPEVKVLEGWTQVWSAPTGGQAKQQVVAQANRSQAPKSTPHRNRSVRVKGTPRRLSRVEG